MTLGSLFDGIGGFPLAGMMCGITPVWSSEIEPFPLKVTEARFPGMKQLGSVTEIDGSTVEPVDIITFGSPCQDLSVAGKQLGIHEGQRSNLFFEAIRIIKEMRDADKANGRSGVDIRPRFAVWENVPGAFSSNRGEDFTAVLEAIAGVRKNDVSLPRPAKWGGAGCVVGDGWSIAWRVYDAQFWGVPQRRKRIYLVADFAGERAGEILFERESVSGDSSEGGAAREGTAGDAEGGAGRSGGVRCLNPWDSNSIRQYTIDGVWPAPRANNGGGQNRYGVCYAVKGNFIDRDTNQNGIGWRDGEMYTLDATDRHGVCYPEIARSLCARADSSPCIDSGQNVVALDCRNFTGNKELSATLQAKPNGGQSLNYINPIVFDARGNGDGCTSPTLTGDHENRVIDYTAICVGNGQLHQTDLGDKAGALNCMYDQQAVITTAKPPRKYIVRRLTPTECARLQGFPDWWCEGLGGSDTAIYKAYGNGLALPCAYDVISRIARVARE